MSECNNLYGSVSFGGGGGGGGGGGLGHNRGITHSANPSTAYGPAAGLHSAGRAGGRFGDLNGNGRLADEGLAAAGIGISIGGMMTGGGIGLGIAGIGVSAAGYADSSRGR